MIRLFFIKNKIKNKKLINNNDDKILEKYKEIAQKEKQEIIQEFNTNVEKGLTNKEVEQRLEEDGENIVVKDDKHSWFYFFANPIAKIITVPNISSPINLFIIAKTTKIKINLSLNEFAKMEKILL